MEMHFGCLQCKCQGRDLPLMRWYAGRLCFGATYPVHGKGGKNWCAAFWMSMRIHSKSCYQLPLPHTYVFLSTVSQLITCQWESLWKLHTRQDEIKPWTWNFCFNFMIFSVHQSYLWSFFSEDSFFFAFVKILNKWHLLTLHFYPVYDFYIYSLLSKWERIPCSKPQPVKAWEESHSAWFRKRELRILAG